MLHDRAGLRKAAVIPCSAVLTLDNAQVWEQIEVSSAASVKAGDQVTIKTGA